MVTVAIASAVALVSAITVHGADRSLELASDVASNAPPTAATAFYKGTSTDGSIVVFETTASLVPQDTNSNTDIYKHVGGVTSLVSADNAGNAVGGFFWGMTPTASHVYFATSASLDAADTDNGMNDIYDRSGSTTTFVSVPTNPQAAATETGATFEGASDDGSVVVLGTYQRMTSDDTDSLFDFYIRSGGDTTRISKPEAGQPARSLDFFHFGSISTTGNHIFFGVSDQLTSDDTDTDFDIYDYTGGHVVLMSRPGTGAEATSHPANYEGATADGTKLLFSSDQQLLAADTDSDKDVYRSSGTSGDPDLMSVPGASPGTSADVDFAGTTSNGNTIWFGTYQSLIGAVDTDTSYDIYAGTANTAATLVSKPGAGDPGDIADDAGFDAASSDGSLVFWETKQKMTGTDTDPDRDIYVSNSGTTELASVATGANTSAPVSFGGISSDGTRLAFATTQQMTGDTDSSDNDVYVRGPFSGSPQTTLASVAGAGAAGGSTDANFEAISGDGTDVLFSTRERLRAEDTNGVGDIYDRAANQTTLISAPEAGAPSGSFPAYTVDVAADGSKVLLQTVQNLTAADTDSLDDVYVRSGGTTSLVVPTNSAVPNGVFSCAASQNLDTVIVSTNMPLTAGDTDTQSDLYSVTGGTPTLLTPGTTDSVNCAGASADASKVIFSTNEQLVGADTDGNDDLYTRSSGAYVLLTPGTTDSISYDSVSSDGSKVFFDSYEDLAGAASDGGSRDVFMSVGGTLTNVSPAQGVSEPSADATFDGISADGTRVVFESQSAFTASDEDDDYDVFVHDQGGTTTQVSQSPGDVDAGASYSRITANGQHIYYYTQESMTSDDLDSNQVDVFDFSGGQTTLVSKPAPGQVDNQGVDFSGVTPDGSHVFLSTYEAMTADDTDTGSQDVYDRSGGQTTRISVAGDGATGTDFDSYFAGASTDGSRVFFTSTSRLTSADTDDAQDVYERSGGVTTAVSPDFVAGSTHQYVSFTGASDDGRTVAMESPGQMLSSDTDTDVDVYVSRLPAPPPPDNTQTQTTPTTTQTTPTETQATPVTTITTTTPPLAAKPRCVVPKLKGLTLKKAKAKLKKAHCRLGKVTKKKAPARSRGKVLAQKPKPRTRKPNGAKVALTLGR